MESLVLVSDAGGRLRQHRIDVVDRCHLHRQDDDDDYGDADYLDNDDDDVDDRDNN